jgi:hypothetical protein
MNYEFDNIYKQSWNILSQTHSEDKIVVRYITVCNYAAGYINAYTVVLRSAEATQHTLFFYTDIRSTKVNEIAQDNRLTVVIYLDDEKVQLVLNGDAIIHHQNDITEQYWTKDGYKGRRSYLAQPGPSTVINEPADGLAHLNGKHFDDTDDAGYENFAVIEIKVNQFEYLKLNREGNRRASFSLNANNEWEGSWLIP